METEGHRDPDPETTARAIEEGIGDGATVVVFARCEVDYDGRASGYLGPGERIVLYKPDGTVLIHRPTGTDPVNWQPPGSVVRTSHDASGCIVTARRSAPEEVLRIHLLEVHQLTAYAAHERLEARRRRRARD